MSADITEEGWAALGDPTRRAIVAALAERPHAVGELAAELPARAASDPARFFSRAHAERHLIQAGSQAGQRVGTPGGG